MKRLLILVHRAWNPVWPARFTASQKAFFTEHQRTAIKMVVGGILFLVLILVIAIKLRRGFLSSMLAAGAAMFLLGCASKPKHPPIWLNELLTKRAEENTNPGITYNTNALRIAVNPLWDAEIGLRDDGAMIWRKIQPLK